MDLKSSVNVNTVKSRSPTNGDGQGTNNYDSERTNHESSQHIFEYKNIFNAVRKEDETAVRKFIDDKVNISAADEYGNGPLYYAIDLKNHALVNILVDAGANVHASCPKGYHLLCYGIKSESLAICKKLIKGGANINGIGSDGNSNLYHAIEANSEDLVRLLIFPGEHQPSPNNVADVNYVGYGGFSILYYAIKKGNLQIVQDLIAANANVNGPSNDRSPLYQSVLLGNIEIVRLLLTHKAQVTAYDIKTIAEIDGAADNPECLSSFLASVAGDASFLADVVKAGNIYLIQLLITHGMDVADADRNSSALYGAVDIGNEDIVKLLVTHGADTNSAVDSKPVLYLAAIEKEDAALTSLLMANAATNIYTEYGGCPILHHAIKKCNASVVRAMLLGPTQPVDRINEQAANYCNALEVALVYSTPDIVEFLVKSGARVTSKASWQAKFITYEEFIVKVSHENLQSALDNSICLKDSSEMIINYTTICNDDRADEILSTLWLVSEQDKFREVLPHPVFDAFIQWMWQSNLAIYYYVNTSFCLLFYVILFWYQTAFYMDDSELGAARIVLYCALLPLAVAFVGREVTQLYLNHRSYVCNFENYIELLVLFYTGCTLLNVDWFSRVQVVGMCNILMALSLTLLLGHTKFAGTSVNILRTVSFTFFKYFTPYVLIFLSFALTFSQLFYTSGKSSELVASNETQTTVNSSETPYLFDILKVLAKFTGELQVTDVSEEKYTFLPVVITIGFIFLCPIIMFNLLNGFAVSNIIDEENLKIFMQKSHLNYLHDAQIYYKIPLFKRIVNAFGLKLRLDDMHKISVYYNKPNLNRRQAKDNRANAQTYPLLSCNTEIPSATVKPAAVKDQIIFSNTLMKEGVHIINKLELSRSSNLPQTILSEIDLLKKILSQMNERFSHLDSELTETRSKLNTRTDDLLQKIHDLNTIIKNK